MDREKALELLLGGADGVREWNCLRNESEDILDLRPVDVSGADLNGAYLSGAKLNGADLSGADLIEANLSEANLGGADLSGAKLIEADLSGANLRRANVRRANVRQANLSGANLRLADLAGTNLRGAKLRGAKLIRANFSGANLSEADLSEANLSEANLSEANLSEAHLIEAKLSRAKLSRANLSRAHLSEANLIRADLSGASLIRANLSGANLSEANFGEADLSGANLSGANFSGANLSRAMVWSTAFIDLDLSNVKSLDQVFHAGPSSLGINTILKSGGSIPQSFLEGCGVPDNWITYLPSLLGKPIDFYSCFISYSHQDEEFSRRLHSRMREDKLRVWYAPEDMKAGRKIHEQIDTAIRLHDKLLVVLSEHSMQSEWVKTEIRNARQREVKEGKRVLFPIRLVPFDVIRDWKAFDADTGKDMAVEIREYFIPDFTNWKVHDAFEAAYQPLMKDFKPAPDDM